MKTRASQLRWRNRPQVEVVLTAHSRPVAEESPAPWMMVSPEGRSQHVPTWTLWAPEHLQAIDGYAERTLESMPANIAKEGHIDPAAQIRRWIASDRPLIRQIAVVMTRRIVAIPLSARQSGEQRLQLAEQIILNLAEGNPTPHPTERQRVERFLYSHPEWFMLLGFYLMAAVGGLPGPTVQQTSGETR